MKNNCNLISFLFVSLAISLPYGALFAQKGAIQDKSIVKFIENNLYGFKQGTKVLVPAMYNYLSDIESNHAIAQKGDKFGVIDQDNNVLLPFDFETISFQKYDGHFLVTKNKLKGVYDQQFKLIIPVQFEQIKTEGTKYYITTSNSFDYQLFDKSGNEPTGRIWKKIIAAGKYWVLGANKLCALYNKELEPITASKFHTLKGIPKAYSQKYADRLFVGGLGSECIVDSLGTDLTPAIFEEVFIRDEVIAGQTGPGFALLSEQGLLLTASNFRDLSCWGNLLFARKSQDYYAFFRPNGTQLTPFAYTKGRKLSVPKQLTKRMPDGNTIQVEVIAEGFLPDNGAVAMAYSKKTDAFYMISGEKWTLCNPIVQPPALPRRQQVFQENGFFGLKNAAQRVVFPPEFDQITVNGNKESILIVEKSGKWAVADSSGQILTPFLYDTMYFSHNYHYLITGKQQDKYHLINFDGTLMYTADRPFFYTQEYNIVVFSGKKMGLIDPDGKLLIAPEYDLLNVDRRKARDFVRGSEFDHYGSKLIAYGINEGVVFIFLRDGTPIKVWDYNK